MSIQPSPSEPGPRTSSVTDPSITDPFTTDPGNGAVFGPGGTDGRRAGAAAGPATTYTAVTDPAHADGVAARRVHVGRLLLGIAAVLVAAVATGLEITHRANLLYVPTPAQWLVGLGGGCVLLGLVGLLGRRLRP